MTSGGLGYRSFFFFSSRRRHTRFKCDWSSDVSSSDLTDTAPDGSRVRLESRRPSSPSTGLAPRRERRHTVVATVAFSINPPSHSIGPRDYHSGLTQLH